MERTVTDIDRCRCGIRHYLVGLLCDDKKFNYRIYVMSGSVKQILRKTAVAAKQSIMVFQRPATLFTLQIYQSTSAVAVSSKQIFFRPYLELILPGCILIGSRTAGADK